MHGFYSAQAAGFMGTLFYRTTDGRVVEVTSVFQSKNPKLGEDFDFEYVGEVTGYPLKDGEEGHFRRIGSLTPAFEAWEQEDDLDEMYGTHGDL